MSNTIWTPDQSTPKTNPGLIIDPRKASLGARLKNTTALTAVTATTIVGGMLAKPDNAEAANIKVPTSAESYHETKLDRYREAFKGAKAADIIGDPRVMGALRDRGVHSVEDFSYIFPDEPIEDLMEGPDINVGPFNADAIENPIAFANGPILNLSTNQRYILEIEVTDEMINTNEYRFAGLWAQQGSDPLDLGAQNFIIGFHHDLSTVSSDLNGFAFFELGSDLFDADGNLLDVVSSQEGGTNYDPNTNRLLGGNGPGVINGAIDLISEPLRQAFENIGVGNTFQFTFTNNAPGDAFLGMVFSDDTLFIPSETTTIVHDQHIHIDGLTQNIPNGRIGGIFEAKTEIIPEPSRGILAVLGLSLAFLRRRR